MMGWMPPSSLARPLAGDVQVSIRIPLFFLIVRPSVRSTLPSVLATMRRRRRCDDKRGARIIELPDSVAVAALGVYSDLAQQENSCHCCRKHSADSQTSSSPLRSAQRSFHLFPSLAKKDAFRLESNLVLVIIRIWAGQAPIS